MTSLMSKNQKKLLIVLPLNSHAVLNNSIKVITLTIKHKKVHAYTTIVLSYKIFNEKDLK